VEDIQHDAGVGLRGPLEQPNRILQGGHRHERDEFDIHVQAVALRQLTSLAEVL
jgi:hypothetical protein